MRRATFWWTCAVACAAGLLATWQEFRRLQWIEGRGADIDVLGFGLGRRGAAAAASRQSPWWQLIKKELRLQQLAIAVALVCAALWIAGSTIDAASHEVRELLLGILTVTFLGVLTLLIGATAGAEEAQLGTAGWQLLLPVPVWGQWAVKSAVALGLALALCVILPATLSYLGFGDIPMWDRTLATAGLVAGVTSLSLYVASTSTSSVRALVATLPLLLLGRFLFWGAWMVETYINARLRPSGIFVARTMSNDPLWAVGVTIFVAVLLTLGYHNYRRPDRSLARRAVHGVAIAGVAFLMMLLPTLAALRW